MNISERYKKEGFVWLPKERKSFQYSDGDENETYILNVIQTSEDLSVGSQELNKKIINWPSKYHLSSQRANLLHPLLSIISGAEVLEVGSGCGVITRYLAESGKEIIALEGSRRRSEITGLRCRDLKNVHVYNDNFLNFEIDKKFDVVTLIGVLEYSNIYSDARDPIQEILKKAKKFLKPNGVLIIAIENRLGLKYFAGAPEDHLNEPYIGIENRYPQKGAVTFGKKELERLLNDADFKLQEFLFAFPDYKFPLAIITNNGIQDQTINIADILKTRTTYYQNSPYTSSFSEEAVWPLIVKNDLVDDLANSFLVLASNTGISKLDTNTLAYTFSNGARKPEFCKVNKFTKNEKGYPVFRERKYPAFQNRSKKIVHDLTEDEYIRGELYLNGLLEILHQKEWNIEAVYDWFKPWVEYLNSLSIKSKEGYYFLDGKYFDASPFNAIISKRGKVFQLFDLEFQIKEELRLDYVLFRTLYYSFNYIDKFQKPGKPIYHKRFEIVLDILKQFFSEDLLDLSYYKSKEEELLKEILETVPAHFFDSNIKYCETEMHSFRHSVFTPLKQITVQFFWKLKDTDFSEAASISASAELHNDVSVIKFEIPIKSGDIDAIRFDIGNEVGFLNIHTIKLVDNSGLALWTWDKVADAQNDAFLIEDKINWPEKVVQLAASDDPYIVIKTGENFNLQIKHASNIELSISALDDQQLQVLKYFPSSLKYTSTIDENGETSIAFKLDSINQKLQVFEEKEKQVVELQNKLVLLLQEKNETDTLAIKAKETLAVQAIQNSKIQLQLQDKIDLLQNKLDGLVKEKNETKILLAVSKEQIASTLAENAKMLTSLQEQIQTVQTKYSICNKENIILQEELKIITKAKELLTMNLRAKEIVEEELEMQIQTLSAQVSKLNDQNIILLDTGRKQEIENKEFNLANAMLIKEVNDLQQKHLATNNRLNKEIEALNSLIERFTDFYEKNNFMTVIYNKLKGKRITP